ncbi:cell growth regulator with EF hand domain protein 1 [Dromaius novaehollandiae]|uniref:cell growth regulator with EF hand domain protein 1 n=1 Tax=Dromaius novaehollandiae TaxID=8790 RepID=UPI00311D8EB9
MRTLRVALLALLLLPAAGAAPRDGLHRPEPPPAVGLEPGEDPLSPEVPVLGLLRSAAERLGPPEPGLTPEQALLYLLALHDHDGSGRLDGLELLRLLSEALARGDAGRPAPDAVALLVDRVLETQDLDGDGLLDPSELLLAPGGDRGAPAAGTGLVRWPEPEPEPEPGAELSAVGQGPAVGQELPGSAAPSEAEVAPVLGDTGDM